MYNSFKYMLTLLTYYMYGSSITIKSIISMFDSMFPSLNIGYMFNIRITSLPVIHYYRDEVLLILNIVYIKLIKQGWSSKNGGIH